MTGKRRSPRGAPRNVKDVYWRPQESGSNTMLNILWRVKENNGLHCIESYNNMNTDAYIYRKAISDRLSKGEPGRPRVSKEVKNLT
jgi:hypothetical protein